MYCKRNSKRFIFCFVLGRFVLAEMNRIRQIIIVLLSLYLSWILSGGFYFRQFVSYRSIKERSYLPFSTTQFLQSKKATEPEEVIETALSRTAQTLNFTFSKCYRDPDKLLKSKKANCIGYAAFCSAACNQLFEESKMKDWKATPQIAKIYVLGINVHQFISSPFFKDHDIVKIENTKTGECFFVDPSLYDYSRIRWVRGN